MKNILRLIFDIYLLESSKQLYVFISIYNVVVNMYMYFIFLYLFK